MTIYRKGKQIIEKDIAKVIYEESIGITEGEDWVIKGYYEPFCDMLGVYQHIPEIFKEYELKKNIKLKYKANDYNKSIIMMWNKTRRGWKPPVKLVTHKKFNTMKHDGKSSAKKGFVGKLYSSMNNYFQTFDSRRTISSVKITSDNISKIATKLKKVSFSNNDYKKFSDLECYVIYCNPPACYYSENGDIFQPFNYDEFWTWCREMSNKNLIIISEYDAPHDFGEILSTSSQITNNGLTETLFLM